MLFLKHFYIAQSVIVIITELQSELKEILYECMSSRELIIHYLDWELQNWYSCMRGQNWLFMKDSEAVDVQYSLF